MSRSRSFRGARRSSGPKNNIWTSVLAAGSSIAAAAIPNFNIVQGTDWERSAAGKEIGTLLSIRGYLTVQNQLIDEALGSGQLMAYIGKFDAGEGVINPGVVGTYVAEDILWTGGKAMPAVAAADHWDGWHVEFNVKAMRRISSGEEIRLVIANQSANAVQATMVIRGLIRASG